MKNETVSTQALRDNMSVVKDLSKQLLGRSVQKARQTSGLLYFLFKVSVGKSLRKLLSGNYSTTQTIKHLAGFS